MNVGTEHCDLRAVVGEMVKTSGEGVAMALSLEYCANEDHPKIQIRAKLFSRERGQLASYIECSCCLMRPRGVNQAHKKKGENRV